MTDLELVNLQDNSDLSTLHFDNEEDWLELRTKGIGGSDIGALMGLNKYTSPLKIYKQKVENWHEDMSDNVFIKKGKDLEDLILKNYVSKKFAEDGYSVLKPDFMIINSTMPYLRANVDGIAFKPGNSFEDNIIVEIKWVSEHAEVNWNKDEYDGVPPSYYAQVQLYMAVTGCKRATICALFDSSWQVHYFNITRNDLFILKLKAVASKFYSYNMSMHIPPMISTELDPEDVVEAIKTAPTPTMPSDEMSKYVEAYIKANEKIKNAEKKVSILKDHILDLHKQGYYPSDSTHKVKTSIVSSHRFNATKFKEDRPDMYEQYCEDSESSRFTIK